MQFFGVPWMTGSGSGVPASTPAPTVDWGMSPIYSGATPAAVVPQPWAVGSNNPVYNAQAENAALINSLGGQIAQDQNFLGAFSLQTNQFAQTNNYTVNSDIYNLGQTAQSNIQNAQNNNCGFLGCGGGLFGSGLF